MSARSRVFILLGIVTLISLAYYWFSTDHSRDLVLIGTVDSNQVIVSPQIQGRIQKLLVDEGTRTRPRARVINDRISKSRPHHAASRNPIGQSQV